MATAKTQTQLIYTCRVPGDLKEYERLAKLAKDAGFTHLDISWMDGLTDFQGEDKDSPWCQWSIVSPSVFKFATPPGLEDAYPAAFVKKQMTFLKKKHEIAKKLGMKCAFYGNEPHWLPQRVYDKHPDWRGSRCDNSLRTVGMFFAPNMDHPEVRAAYRYALREIAKACPLIDTYFFMDNDSGSGFTWGNRLYVNPNGPTGYENVDMGVRTMEFVRNMREGVIEAGVENPRFFQLGWCSPEEEKLIKRSCEPGLGMLYKLPFDPKLISECSLGYGGTWGGHGSWWPVLVDQPTPMSVLGAVTRIKSGPQTRFQFFGEGGDLFPAFKAAMQEEIATTERQKLHVLGKMAEAVYGTDDVTDMLVDAWVQLDRTDGIAGASGANMTHAMDHLRWLTRPLVAHQDLLTEEERSYWEPYIYQSKKAQPESYLDYLNHSGYKMCSSWDAATPMCIAIDYIEGMLKQVMGKLGEARDATKNKEAKHRIQMDIYRIAARRSTYLTSRHFLQVGTLIYLREEMRKQREARGEVMTSTSPEMPDLPKGNMGSHGLFFLHRALRWELDNVNELIKLMEESPVPLFTCAPKPDMVCSFLFAADLLEQVKKKRAIMIKHWRDAEIGWYRPTLGG